jgi:hypothetical protein
MNGSSIKLEVVRDVNDEVVSPISDDSWSGNSAVESKGKAGVSIWRDCSVFNRQPILLSLLDFFLHNSLLLETRALYLSSDSGIRSYRVVVCINRVVSPTASGCCCVLTGRILASDEVRDRRNC